MLSTQPVPEGQAQTELSQIYANEHIDNKYLYDVIQ